MKVTLSPPQVQEKGSTMDPSRKKKIEHIYRACRSIMGSDTWDRILEAGNADSRLEAFPDTVEKYRIEFGLPEFLPELARLEWTLHKTTSRKHGTPFGVSRLMVNPTARLVQLSWKNLPEILKAKRNSSPVTPQPGEEVVLIWKNPKTGHTEIEAASNEDLLALKVVVEGIDPKKVALEGRVPVATLDVAIDRAVDRGILLRPRSRIQRDPATFPTGKATNESFLSASVFTLQWHVTQACDLHCKHCYDRSERVPLKLDQALAILDDLYAFCRGRHVKGQVSFTGGNPLLHPQFIDLYRAAAERGFTTAILGNPAPRKRIEELLAIQRPSFFQVSLEGLPDHNDSIRGPGHFERVIQFLKVLRELGIYSMVMLTLTKDNLDQVLPLAEVLGDRTDSFTFNRLSRVGEGARLQLPPPEAYSAFLELYFKAVEKNPILALKDNLINILCHQKGGGLFGGCTGYGCGAAFNFLTVLPDGEVHACRKFPPSWGMSLNRA